jgi:2-desacetyl-2-hydroxyethyl bacteriochlorophyllide A dehydrogenase
MSSTMLGAYLPGKSQVELRDVAVPSPGPGQVVVAIKASTICGSDLRAIYREHLGEGPEAYAGVIAGHEPAGEIVELGPNMRRFRIGDRVAVYHIAGCGVCRDCRNGYMISCSSRYRAAYGWQRDGGHAEYMLTDESTCVLIPDELSYIDGACTACGFGTAYEAVCRAEVSGRDTVVVTGLGPVGLGVGLLARALGSHHVIGVDPTEQRRKSAMAIGAVDHAVAADDDAVDQVRGLTAGRGAEVAIDCSGATDGRRIALESTRQWGRCVLVGEGTRLEVDASPTIIHPQRRVIGSWVTSLGRMEDLLEHLARWQLHPEVTVSDRFALNDAAEAYRVADGGCSGKVAIIPALTG